MALFALLLLVFGFLATGATRKNVYSGAKCIMGGRISAAFVSKSTGSCFYLPFAKVQGAIYRIFPAIKRGFRSSRMTSNN